MTAIQILIGVASVLDRDEKAAEQNRLTSTGHCAHLAMQVRAAIDLIKGGEYREFEFKGVMWTKLPSGKIVRGK
jgi:hypothetical protein